MCAGGGAGMERGLGSEGVRSMTRQRPELFAGDAGASVRIDGEAPDVAQVTRGPLGVTLPSDQPSAGQRAGRGSGSRSLRSITRLARLRRCDAITTTVDVSEVEGAGARWRRPCG